MNRSFAISTLAASLLLGGCANLPPSPPESPATSAAAPALLEDGELTQAGQQQRDAGARQIGTDHHDEAYALWLPLAEAGHAESQYNIGLMTARGMGTPVDLPASLAWLRKAAAGKFRAAVVELGLRFHRGTYGVEKDQEAALRHFLDAAELGDGAGAYHAGRMLYFGEEVEKDLPRGLDLLVQAAQAETPVIAAQAMLGRIYMGNAGIPSDHRQARYWLEQAADGDDRSAQHDLAVLYQHGRGGPRDLRKARAWYERAAQQGHAGAMNRLGLLSLAGKGMPRDAIKAARYFEQAHTKGNLEATVNLADMLVHGDGVERDVARGVNLYRQGAQASHGRSQCRYAQALRQGVGVPRDVAAAKQWEGKSGLSCQNGLKLLQARK